MSALQVWSAFSDCYKSNESSRYVMFDHLRDLDVYARL